MEIRPVWEGFFVTMYEGTCSQEAQILRPQAEWLDIMFEQAWVCYGNDTKFIDFNLHYKMTFCFLLVLLIST